MSYDDAPAAAPTTLDLLGRRWTTPGAVTDAVFNRDATAVAFAAGDGLSIAAVADPEDAEGRIRAAADTGRLTIRPRAKPARPLERAAGLAGAVGPFGARGFLTGRAGGGLAVVTARGQVTPSPHRLDGPPAAVAADPASSAVAVAAGGVALILREDAPEDRLTLDAGRTATCLRFAADGATLAVGHDAGVTLFRRGSGSPAGAALDGAVRALAFSADRRFLAAAGEFGLALVSLQDMTVSRLGGFPTAAASVAVAGAAIVASGAFRVAGWALGLDGLGAPLDCGRPGLVVVDRVAADPARGMVAAGYASGLTLLTRPGERGEMLLRERGGAVTALAFSPDGRRLAFGDADGEAALVSLPATLFKHGDAR